MRKSISFLSARKSVQIAFLIVVLLVGWAVFSILRLVKGEWVRDKRFGFEKSNLLGVDAARANVPADAPVGSSTSASSTPFFAVWNGNQYAIENDFMFGKPRGYFFDFIEGRRHYESGWVASDLYKIQSTFEKKGGALNFQIQEIEPEESFINGMTLLRIVHPATSDIIVDANHDKFYVLNNEKFTRSFIEPSSIENGSARNLLYLADKENLYDATPCEFSLEENKHIDIKFTDVQSGGRYSLVVKSYYRDWVMGEDDSALARAQSIARSLLNSRILPRVTAVSFAIFASWADRKGGSLLPFVMLGGGGSGGGSSSSSSSCCLPVLFKDSNGYYRQFNILEPRAWKYSVEMTEIPPEAITRSGELQVRISATKRHQIAFIGLLRDPESEAYRVEALEVTKAWHRRLGKDVAGFLRYPSGQYLHTIPGDVVDVEFEEPRVEIESGMQETYLLRSAGFYTPLSLDGKKAAGGWENRLSEEARKRLVCIREAQMVGTL